MSNPGKRVLVAPLDWGLGHATRCIPIISLLASHGVETLIGASGNSLLLLKQEFPNLPFISLPGIGIRYPENGSMAIHMALRVPGILRSISREHNELQQLITQYGITHVISDNRYGLYSRKAKTAFITHQVHVRASKGFRFMEPLLFRLSRRFIGRFNELWIPDTAPPGNLSMALSDASRLSIPVRFTGLLSRFSDLNRPGATREFDYIALLSGPEPQRTLLEKKVRDFFSSLNKNCLLVQGIPGGETRSQTGSMSIRSVISSAELIRLLHPDTTLVARPGYSTLMDMAVLNHHRLILVPTPGQTEQEYLAERMRERSYTVLSQHEPFPMEPVPAGKPLPFADDRERLKKIVLDFIV